MDSGDWIRRESGIGAGLDSYYEYVLKSYILLGDDTYLHRFHRHYAALLKYVMKDSRMLDVHMHQPGATSKPYLDALTAFFPGLQVLYGDVELAKNSYKVLSKFPTQSYIQSNNVAVCQKRIIKSINQSINQSIEKYVDRMPLLRNVLFFVPNQSINWAFSV